MANLTYLEKRKLESFLEMGGGYVLNFTNYDLKEFVKGCVGLDIYSSKYDFGSGSKANRIRMLWDVESNQTVAKLLESLAEYWITFVYPAGEQRYIMASYNTCLQIAERLKNDNSIEDIDAIKPNLDDDDFDKLAQSVREDIIKNLPEVAMDRLHTFVSKYIRGLCDKRGIAYDTSNPLNSTFGKYVKHLKEKKLVESEMALRILSTSISVLEHFNDVRNNKSFAHPNALLNYDESLLIFKYISGLINFLDALEIKMDADAQFSSSVYVADKANSVDVADDLPF